MKVNYFLFVTALVFSSFIHIGACDTCGKKKPYAAEVVEPQGDMQEDMA
ncbi:hypothetical protein H0X48_01255 [Candidatus Dependentiae bacterium]|nr:hypothetical protein [Candidatus Dependentiae bacterium]